MASCCNICVDPTCGGKKNCNCDTCTKKGECYRLRGLKPTIRITRKCTQACNHCCFACSPKDTEMMTVEMAHTINVFCHKNNIRHMEVMGGEFFCHPRWEEVLGAVAEGMKVVRLVTNGDWAGNEELANKVVAFLRAHPQFHVGLSKDEWHTNTHVDSAVEFLARAHVAHRVPSLEEIKEDSIVPIGRGDLYSGFYSMFGAYCSKPDRRYNFLIDERGIIYKCGFGAWPYANVAEYIDGGFDVRFKEFYDVFYQACVMNCSQCQRAERRTKNKI